MHISFRNGFEKCGAASGQCSCPHCGNPVVLTAPVVMDPSGEQQVPDEMQPQGQQQPVQPGQESGQQAYAPEQQSGASGPAGDVVTPQRSTAVQATGGIQKSTRNFGELSRPEQRGQSEYSPQQQAGAAGETGIPQQSTSGDRPPMQGQGPQKRSARDYGEQHAGSASPYSSMY